MRRPVITIIILFSVALGNADAQARLFSTGKPYGHVTTDIQGVVYLTDGHSVDSYTAEGLFLRNYSRPALGDIGNVDAGIASKILVFHRESGAIVLLNSELSPIGPPLNLFDKSLMTVTMAAMGNSNSIVLYDEANQELILSDLGLNSLKHIHIDFPGEFHPTDLQVVPEHRIALLDTVRGICLFDFFGTFERSIPIPGIRRMQLMKDCVAYLRDGRLWLYDLPSASNVMDLRPILNGLSGAVDFRIWKNTLYYIGSEGSDRPVMTMPLGL